MIRQCCQCKRVHQNGHWVYPRFNQLNTADVSHGYCEDCFSKQINKIKRQRRAVPELRPWWLRMFG